MITIIPVYLGVPPYNFTISQQGLVFLGPCIGNLVGSVICGYLNDRLSQWSSRRNDGVFEPEMRLPVVIFPALLVPAGLLMFGCGVHNGVHWIVPTIGAGLIGVALTGIGSIVQPYLMDSYAPITFDCLVVRLPAYRSEVVN
jgi:MFS family permease